MLLDVRESGEGEGQTMKIAVLSDTEGRLHETHRVSEGRLVSRS